MVEFVARWGVTGSADSATSKDVSPPPKKSNTPNSATDNADSAVQTDSIVSAVSSTSGHIPPESEIQNPDLTDVIPRRDGSDLERLAYEVRDTRLIAQCRDKAVELQGWLTDNCDEHMATEPFGSPKWVAALAEFLVIEDGQLRNVLHFEGCIHDRGFCPTEAPVSCSACEDHDE